MFLTTVEYVHILRPGVGSRQREDSENIGPKQEYSKGDKQFEKRRMR